MSNFSMLDLFRMEVESQRETINDNLLVLETNPNAVGELEALMRAAHSIKGAARIVQLDAAVQIAHAMEDCFVAAQNGAIAINSAAKIDILFQGIDTISQISQVAESQIANWLVEHQPEIENLVASITSILTQTDPPPLPPSPTPPLSPSPTPSLYRDAAMLNLFRQEIESNTAILNATLELIKTNPKTTLDFNSLIQAAHTIKGAAKIVQIDTAVRVAAPLEDWFIALREGTIVPDSNQVELFQPGIDMLLRIAQVADAEIETWTSQNAAEIENLVATMTAVIAREKSAVKPEEKPIPPTIVSQTLASQTTPSFAPPAPENPQVEAAVVPPTQPSSQSTNNRELTIPVTNVASAKPTENPSQSQPAPISNPQPTTSSNPNADRVVRVSAENLNRLMGLAGESLVEANWLQPFADSLLKLKHSQAELSKILEQLQESLTDQKLNERANSKLNAARQKAGECREVLSDRLSELELFARRSSNLSDRLYREVIASHMRPFADGVQGFPRMLRDLSRRLEKQIKFEILGKSTQVDRDILEKLEAPLTHILRNALDHGIETPEERLAAGKPLEGSIRLEAAHRGGMLLITVTDDGKGVNLDKLRQKIINKGMASAEMVAQMTEPELMDFLFLPGFSTANQVTEISGRGVGLDVVQSMIQEVGGILRAVSQFGKGMSFHLQLPLTLSVIRTLLVEIAGEPYAFPLTRIDRIVMVNRAEISVVESRQYFSLDGQNIGLLSAHQVLELPDPDTKQDALPAIILSDRYNRYGLVVDRFLGEHDLVVKPLDPRLGKVPDISAVALMGDGSAVLIVDVEDTIRSIDKILTAGRLRKVSQHSDSNGIKKRKRILVVDDSITVREVERKLLENNGYEVEVAVNGMEGWNAVRTGHFDLAISDVDMPRMTGIELVSQIKSHPSLKSLPVIIVSYKDREEDRIRGLEVGADYYLTKSSFHDDTLLNAVIDLIGTS